MTEKPIIHSTDYPNGRVARDRWIIRQRGDRQSVSSERPHGYFWEDERGETGDILETLTIFLTNRECPWRCLMCDLWKTTLPESVPIGAIPRQIDYAFGELGCTLESPSEGSSASRQLKLYNGGSFFDPRAVPVDDYDAVAARAARFRRVIVECHPAFVTERCLAFQAALARAARALASGPAPTLEVAMGLETVEPTVLERLNKGMTLELFKARAYFLQQHGIALRAFVLVKPPFLDETAALLWAQRSVEFAFDVGATVVSLIPTRGGNGAMEALQRNGQFSPPTLATLEAAQAFGIALERGRVFADVWDLTKFSDCACCYARRLERMRSMNLEQRIVPSVCCSACGAGGSYPRSDARA